MAKIYADLLLTDIGLDVELDGIAAAERNRSSSNVPIVFPTGYSQESLIRQVKTTAPPCYLIKPVPARELKAIIKKALCRQKLKRES